MNRSDTGRPSSEAGRGPGLVEPIWRYQDACAIGPPPDEPNGAGRGESTVPDRVPRVERVRHVRTY
jgi:hypothetical protein